MTNNVLYFSDISPSEKSRMLKNPIYLDHCYYKHYPSSENFNNPTSTGIQHINSK